MLCKISPLAKYAANVGARSGLWYCFVIHVVVVLVMRNGQWNSHSTFIASQGIIFMVFMIPIVNCAMYPMRLLTSVALDPGKPEESRLGAWRERAGRVLRQGLRNDGTHSSGMWEQFQCMQRLRDVHRVLGLHVSRHCQRQLRGPVPKWVLRQWLRSDGAHLSGM